MTKPTHIEAFVHAQHSYDDEYTFNVFSCDMSSCGYIPIAKIEVPVPDLSIEQIKARHLVLLRLKREDVYKQAAKQAADLDEQIARIESITYNPTQQEPSE